MYMSPKKAGVPISISSAGKAERGVGILREGHMKVGISHLWGVGSIVTKWSWSGLNKVQTNVSGPSVCCPKYVWGVSV